MSIIDKIKFEEGDKASMYKCPAGKWTIGAGINLEAQEMPQEVRDLWGYLGMDYGQDWILSLLCGGEMPQEVRDLWLDIIITENESAITSRMRQGYGLLYYYEIPDGVRVVLQDMAYQMGVNGLFKFVNMLIAIERGLYTFAAEHLLDSNYARQTPARANRNAKLLRGCA